MRTMTALALFPDLAEWRWMRLKGNTAECVQLLESWSFTVIRRRRRTRGSSRIQEDLAEKEMNEAKPHGGAEIVVQMTCSLLVMLWSLYVFTSCLVRHGGIQHGEGNGCGLEVCVFTWNVLELASCNNMPT